MRRREFISTATGAAALFSSHACLASHASDAPHSETVMTEPTSSQAAARIPRVAQPGTMKGEMLYRELGQTGGAGLRHRAWGLSSG